MTVNSIIVLEHPYSKGKQSEIFRHTEARLSTIYSQMVNKNTCMGQRPNVITSQQHTKIFKNFS